MDKAARDTRTLDLKLIERHPLKVVAFAFGISIAAVIFMLAYVYVPSRLSTLKRLLQECQTQKAEAEAKIPVPPQDPDALALTSEEVRDEYKKRSGRDAEQDAFAKSLDAKNIHWDVVISRPADQNGYAFIRLRDASSVGPISMVIFSRDCRVRAASLHAGDLIHVDGTLSYSSRTDVYIENATFTFIEANAEAPKKPL